MGAASGRAATWRAAILAALLDIPPPGMVAVYCDRRFGRNKLRPSRPAPDGTKREGRATALPAYAQVRNRIARKSGRARTPCAPPLAFAPHLIRAALRSNKGGSRSRGHGSQGGCSCGWRNGSPARSWTNPRRATHDYRPMLDLSGQPHCPKDSLPSSLHTTPTRSHACRIIPKDWHRTCRLAWSSQGTAPS